ncbi:hypothetical protein ACFX13_023869 [Malus domestica]
MGLFELPNSILPDPAVGATLPHNSSLTPLRCRGFEAGSLKILRQQAIMLKFAISLMRKIVHTVEANVPLDGIMAKLQFGNNVLRNDSCKLEKHLEVRVKILEAINDRRV